MIKRPFRYYYLKLLRQRGTPEQIAMGVAVGIFVGLFIPPLGQIFFAVLFATLLNANRITACLATWISNPVTFFIIYPFYLWLGANIMGHSMSFIEIQELMKEGADEIFTLFVQILKDYALAYFIGASICTIIFTPLSYFLSLKLIVKFRLKKQARIEKKKRARKSKAIKNIT